MQKKNFLLFQEIYIAANHVSGKDLFWNPSRLAKGAGNILLLQALLDSVHLLELSALLVGRKKITLVSVIGKSMENLS